MAKGKARKAQNGPRGADPDRETTTVTDVSEFLDEVDSKLLADFTEMGAAAEF